LDYVFDRALLTAETLWLTQHQLEELFSTDRTSLVKHIQNILDTGELAEAATCAKFAQVGLEGKRQVSRGIRYYNLDMILSVGYRVNSKRGTQFRIWANRILKEHLVQGYTINQKRLTEQQNQITRLKESIQLVERSLPEQIETIDVARKMVKISEFARGLNTLDDYDHETLEQKGRTEQTARFVSENEFLEVVEVLRRDFDSPVFALPRDKSFSSSVNQIYRVLQTKSCILRSNTSRTGMKIACEYPVLLLKRIALIIIEGKNIRQSVQPDCSISRFMRPLCPAEIEPCTY
jgi:hypothetical protein